MVTVSVYSWTLSGSWRHAMCFCCDSHAIWSICGHSQAVAHLRCPENASSKLEISMVITGIPGVFRLTWRDNSFFVIYFMTSSSFGFKTMSLASWAEGEILTTPLKNALWQSSHKSIMEWMWICSAPCCETAHKVPCMKVHIDFLPGCEERADLFLTTAVSICKRST